MRDIWSRTIFRQNLSLNSFENSLALEFGATNALRRLRILNGLRFGLNLIDKRVFNRTRCFSNFERECFCSDDFLKSFVIITRIVGIEPTHTVLKTVVLPLNYIPLILM